MAFADLIFTAGGCVFTAANFYLGYLVYKRHQHR